HQNQNRGRQGNRPYNRPQDNRGFNRPENQGNRGNQVRGGHFCYKCGEKGHYANDCGNQARLCYNCQKPGHFIKDCQAPKVAPPTNVTQGTRPAARGRVYYMGTGVSGQASNANHEDDQTEGCLVLKLKNVARQEGVNLVVLDDGYTSDGYPK
ncbi:TIR-NBS-LRR resistance protein, partial [Trifolium medium]|nr:TIR-NBS-LRR resistance protein [Trifolium medium]